MRVRQSSWTFEITDGGRCVPGPSVTDICNGHITATAYNAQNTATISTCEVTDLIAGGPSSQGNLPSAMDLPTQGNVAVPGVPTTTAQWQNEMQTAINDAFVATFGSSAADAGFVWLTFGTATTTGCP